VSNETVIRQVAEVEIPLAQPMADIRSFISRTLQSRDPKPHQRKAITEAVVAELCRVGRFYYFAARPYVEMTMYFHRGEKSFMQVRSDWFKAWLSLWAGVNQAEAIFPQIYAAVRAAAHCPTTSTGIIFLDADPFVKNVLGARPGDLFPDWPVIEAAFRRMEKEGAV
jgi:hypothetical protein